VFDVAGDTTLSKSVQPASGGAPRWTYVIGAIVGAAGLFWTVTSYFFSHSRSPDPASSGYVPASSITVSGSGIGVGQMNGGQINQELPPPVLSSKSVEPEQ
jgi:hypothetical protein